MKCEFQGPQIQICEIKKKNFFLPKQSDHSHFFCHRWVLLGLQQQRPANPVFTFCHFAEWVFLRWKLLYQPVFLSQVASWVSWLTGETQSSEKPAGVRVRRWQIEKLKRKKKKQKPLDPVFFGALQLVLRVGVKLLKLERTPRPHWLGSW